MLRGGLLCKAVSPATVQQNLPPTAPVTRERHLNQPSHLINRGIDSSSPKTLAAGPSRARPTQASNFPLIYSLLSHIQNSRRHVY